VATADQVHCDGVFVGVGGVEVGREVVSCCVVLCFAGRRVILMLAAHVFVSTSNNKVGRCKGGNSNCSCATHAQSAAVAENHVGGVLVGRCQHSVGVWRWAGRRRWVLRVMLCFAWPHVNFKDNNVCVLRREQHLQRQQQKQQRRWRQRSQQWWHLHVRCRISGSSGPGGMCCCLRRISSMLGGGC
jgi:hypothetical protein